MQTATPIRFAGAMRPEAAIVVACRRIGRPLTEAELDARIAEMRDAADTAIERLCRRDFADTEVEAWELPHTAQRPNDAAPEPFARVADPDTLPPQDFAGCTGDCEQGRRDCTCSRALLGLGTFEPERSHPWRWAAFYLTVIVLAIAASSRWPWGWAL